MPTLQTTCGDLLRAAKRDDPARENDDALIDGLDHALQRMADSADRPLDADERELQRELLDWELLAESTRKRSVQTRLLTLRWRVLAESIRRLTSAQDELAPDAVVTRMAGDRFAALEVQTAIAATLAIGIGNGFFPMDTVVLDLTKQFYVTLHDAKVRDALVMALTQRLVTKDDVKALVNAGLCRAMLQTALDALRAEAALTRLQGDDAAVGGDAETEEEEEASESSDAASVALVRNAVDVFKRMSRLMCPSPATQNDFDLDELLPALCGSVVSLGLCRVTLVLEDVVRLLQMLVEYAPTESVLVAKVPDLRGVLEKLTVLTTTPSTRPTIADAGLAQLARGLRDRLLPQIDAFERLNGSLVGLPTDDDDNGERTQVNKSVVATAERELERAALCKTRGNAFFQRGNVCTARAFYRRAIALLRQAEAQAEQRLSSLDQNDVLAQCSVGTSVLVRQRDGSRRSAMVADVEGDAVEVIYDGDNGDDDEEEETVPFTRIQLRLPTALLQRFLTLHVDCAMNMGKVFTQLSDHENAVQCFTHALEKQPHHIAALYQRGIAYMALHDMRSAQQDLWSAHQRCRAWKISARGDADELSREKAQRDTLLGQITTAYKKLQTLHANKKKVDKKLIKQMMNYLSTVPGLQDQSSDS